MGSYHKELTEGLHQDQIYDSWRDINFFLWTGFPGLKLKNLDHVKEIFFKVLLKAPQLEKGLLKILEMRKVKLDSIEEVFFMIEQMARNDSKNYQVSVSHDYAWEVFYFLAMFTLLHHMMADVRKFSSWNYDEVLAKEMVNVRRMKKKYPQIFVEKGIFSVRNQNPKSAEKEDQLVDEAPEIDYVKVLAFQEELFEAVAPSLAELKPEEFLDEPDKV